MVSSCVTIFAVEDEVDVLIVSVSFRFLEVWIDFFFNFRGQIGNESSLSIANRYQEDFIWAPFTAFNHN